MSINLKKYNTFGIAVSCAKLIEINNRKEFVEYATDKDSESYKILGGGSNILFTSDLDSDVVLNKIKGINIQKETEEEVFVEVGSGENWHNFVMWAVSHNLGGVENLALIPGTVGAAPIQNIGAYGGEQKDVFLCLRCVDKSTLKDRIFTNIECMFGYRDSYFKNRGKDKFFITSVTYCLKKNPVPNIAYKDVTEYLSAKNIAEPTIADVANAVIDIRTKKLPDPKEIGNAGSFFKNPIIDESVFTSLQIEHPNLPSYPVDEGRVKLPAAWLIDQCGLKGVTKGNTGTHSTQALVIVNKGKATGKEIEDFSISIQKTVAKKFAVELEAEVNIW